MSRNKKQQGRPGTGLTLVRKGGNGRPQKVRTGDWKGALAAIIEANNARHATREKGVSHRTMQAREQGLFRIFHQLRGLGFRIDPTKVGGRHVEALMQYWSADPALPAILAGRGGAATITPLEAPQSAAYLQQQLSILRVYFGWINKPGVVRAAETYVSAPELVRRATATTVDKSWIGAEVDIDAAIERVRARDIYVAAQLELMLAFGLRRKEAVMFSPLEAEVPREGVPPGAVQLNDYLCFVKLKRGTKGGRLRYTAIRNERQRRAIEQARALHAQIQTMVDRGQAHLGRPGLSLKQSLDRFDYMMKVAGITCAVLRVTPHGLRHQFAADLYFDLADVPAPVRGPDATGSRPPGAGPSPAAIRDAYLEIARQLGHNRTNITAAYLGKMPTASAPRER